MSKIVANMKKMKANQLHGMFIHNERKTTKHSNKDIDPSKSDLNIEFINENHISYNKLIMDYINKNKSTKRAVRKDAVVVDEWIISSDRDFFANMDQQQTLLFFDDAVQYFKTRYGAENVRYASVHFDETTPHMHLGIVPFTKDYRLSSKEVFTKQELTFIQEDLPKHLQSKGYVLDRGNKNSRRRHLDTAEYKMLQEKISDELVELVEPAEYDERGLQTNRIEQDVVRSRIKKVGNKRYVKELERNYYDREFKLAELDRELKAKQEDKERLEAENERLEAENKKMANYTEHAQNTLRAILRENNIVPKEDEPVYFYDGFKKPIFLGSIKEFYYTRKEVFLAKVTVGYSQIKREFDISAVTRELGNKLATWKQEVVDYVRNLRDKPMSRLDWHSDIDNQDYSRSFLFINPDEWDLRHTRVLSKSNSYLDDFNELQEGKNVASHYVEQIRRKGRSR